MAMFDKRKDSDSMDSDPASSFSQTPEPSPRPLGGVSAPREIAVIGKTITITGDVSGEESLVIDGKVKGTVLLKKNDLTIGQSGHVTANVTANVVRIEGEVTGDLNGSEKVVITKTGRVRGNVVAPRVTLEDGAKFKGSIDMDPGPATSQAPAPQTLRSVSPSQSAPAAAGPIDDLRKG